MNGLKISLIISLINCSISKVLANHESWVLDGRFTTMDIVAMVNQNYSILSNKSELISHYSGYYSINPILLSEYLLKTNLEVKAQAEILFNIIHSTTKQNSLNQLNSNLVDNAKASMLGLVKNKRMNVATDENRPVFDLPFDHKSSWFFNGVHTWTGANDGTPMSSIDVTKNWDSVWGDNTSNDYVSAAHDGTISVLSSCYIRITHESGWGTEYYHLSNILFNTGDKVKAGELIANYANTKGQALCDGGSSSGPHLHFSLLKNGRRYALNAISLSLWNVHTGTSSYDNDPSRMWLEKNGNKNFSYSDTVNHLNGDNEIDYRYNGIYTSEETNGHGLNITVTQQVNETTQEIRNIIFLAFYTYDDQGNANFYAGNVDYDNWRLDETKTVEMIQTSGGNFTDLQAVDFATGVTNAGTIGMHFLSCTEVEVEISLIEPVSSNVIEHNLILSKTVGTPDHVCQQPSSLLILTTQPSEL